jgi:hypothetical protein
LLVRLVEGRLRGCNLLLLDSNQGLLLSDQRILLGDGRDQFLDAAIQSVKPFRKLVRGTSVILALRRQSNRDAQSACSAAMHSIYSCGSVNTSREFLLDHH